MPTVEVPDPSVGDAALHALLPYCYSQDVELEIEKLRDPPLNVRVNELKDENVTTLMNSLHENQTAKIFAQKMVAFCVCKYLFLLQCFYLPFCN